VGMSGGESCFFNCEHIPRHSQSGFFLLTADTRCCIRTNVTGATRVVDSLVPLEEILNEGDWRTLRYWHLPGRFPRTFSPFLVVFRLRVSMVNL
jgi:hypothetical protein